MVLNVSDVIGPYLVSPRSLERHLLWRMRFLLGAFQAIQAAVESKYSATGPGAHELRNEVVEEVNS